MQFDVSEKPNNLHFLRVTDIWARGSTITITRVYYISRELDLCSSSSSSSSSGGGGGDGS